MSGEEIISSEGRSRIVGILVKSGDTVFHRPSQETWKVAHVDYEVDPPMLWWEGWPYGSAPISDCDLTVSCSPEEEKRTIIQWASRHARPSHREGRDGRYLYARREALRRGWRQLEIDDIRPQFMAAEISDSDGKFIGTVRMALDAGQVAGMAWGWDTRHAAWRRSRENSYDGAVRSLLEFENRMRMLPTLEESRASVGFKPAGQSSPDFDSLPDEEDANAGKASHSPE